MKLQRLAPFAAFGAVFALALAPLVAPSAHAQRRIIGAGDEPVDAGPAPAPADAGPAKKDDKKKKADEKKPDEKKADEKKPDEKKPDAAATKKDDKKKDDKRDVLEDTPTEKVTKSKEEEKKAAAEKKAEEAAEAEKLKKEAEKKKLEDEKKAADAKKKLENKDQRLAAARKIRQLTRTSGAFAISIAVEPGQVVKDGVLELRIDVAQKLDVPDPKFGSLMPIKNADVVATVTGGKGRTQYAVHPLETPGRYGFHTTPVKDGVMQVSISGSTKDNKSFEATFPVHVGVWPPPDFEDEEKNNLATTDTSRGAARSSGGNDMITSLVLMVAIAGAPEDRPLIGDVVNGERLLKKAGADVKIDGAWLNLVSDEQILLKLEKGADGFPQIDSENVLDRWDVLATLRAKNADVRDLSMEANTVLVMTTKYDEHAETRLKDQAKLKDIDGERRVFGMYKLEADKSSEHGGPQLTFVAEKDNKKRDKLKKSTKVGYTVFTKIPGFRGGKYEAAFAIDKDMRITRVEIHGPDGAPVDLNQAAARFVGKGARGQYAALKAGGAGKAIGELERPLSDAYLLAAESVYMFEVVERDYFAFDD